MRYALFAAAVIDLIFSAALQAEPNKLGTVPNDALQKPAEVQKATPSGPDTTTEFFGDWSIICGAPAAGSNERSCEVDTTLTVRGQTAPIARIAFVRQAKDKPTRIVALVPVNVTIASGVKIESDPGKSGVNLTFKSCVPAACIADGDTSKEQVQGFRTQSKAGQITFADASGKTASLQFSLHGLDQALNSFFKRQEK